MRGNAFALSCSRGVIGRHLLGELASQLDQVVELGLETACAGGRRPQLDDEVLNLKLGNVRLDDVPAIPAGTAVEAQDLAAPG